MQQGKRIKNPAGSRCYRELVMEEEAKKIVRSPAHRRGQERDSHPQGRVTSSRRCRTKLLLKWARVHPLFHRELRAWAFLSVFRNAPENPSWKLTRKNPSFREASDQRPRKNPARSARSSPAPTPRLPVSWLEHDLPADRIKRPLSLAVVLQLFPDLLQAYSNG
jgi:hypothetical protein